MVMPKTYGQPGDSPRAYVLQTSQQVEISHRVAPWAPPERIPDGIPDAVQILLVQALAEKRTGKLTLHFQEGVIVAVTHETTMTLSLA